MKTHMRDRQLVLHIIKYTEEIEKTIERFGNDEKTFMDDVIYRNAVSMPLLQIGELAKHLSPEFIEQNSQIP